MEKRQLTTADTGEAHRSSTQQTCLFANTACPTPVCLKAEAKKEPESPYQQDCLIEQPLITACVRACMRVYVRNRPG